jgi:leucyl aminopeptidase
MKITFAAGNPFSQPLPVLVVPVFQNERIAAPASLRAVLRHIQAKEFDGSDKQLLLLHTAGKPGVRPARVVFAGLGPRSDFNLENLRRAIGLASKKIRDAGLDRAGVFLNPENPEAAAAVVEAAVLALYKFTEFKPDRDEAALQSLVICVSPKADLPACKAAGRRAQLVAESSNFARSLGNLPGNVIYPATLAERARQLADDCGLRCTVLDKKALHRGGFGGLLAVGGGSAHEPRLTVLEYRGAGADQKPVALVGKAITFDTGGISIKPADKMDEMKFDKCGGCAVLGILRAAAQLKLPLNLLGVIAAAENMPGATSYRPGDIITSYRGKDPRATTIEVLNTDAEGRIVLGDALAYARERQPQAILDFATLTGACVVALGNFAAGLFGNDDSLLEKLRAAGERSGERVWPLPLWKDYRELIQSDVADHKNQGPRAGGAITAAAFLAKYVGDTPWAHFDMAGTAWTTEERPYLAKGATGFGVRLVLDALGNWR